MKVTREMVLALRAVVSACRFAPPWMLLAHLVEPLNELLAVVEPLAPKPEPETLSRKD